jgi:hypothetical protein
LYTNANVEKSEIKKQAFTLRAENLGSKCPEGFGFAEIKAATITQPNAHTKVIKKTKPLKSA